MSEPRPSPERLRELRDGLDRVRGSIAQACAEAGRAPGSVTLIAVTKTFPAADIRALASLGVTDIGENRDGELRSKAPDCADLEVRWHFVGQLQSNKARSVIEHADVVHSVDRPSLLHALSKAVLARRAHPQPGGAGTAVRCLLQVSLSDDAGQAQRGGVLPAAVDELADLVAAADGLALGGVMAVAPLGADPDRAFAELAATAERVRRHHPSATWVSAGMSADLAAAVRHGATHVRVGRALLGTRGTLG